MNKINQVIIAIVTLLGVSVWYIRRKAYAPKPKTNVIIVGTNAEFQPLTFKKNGAIVGFDIDIIREVSKRLDKVIQIKDMPFDALIPEIQLGNVHVIAAGMTPTEERAKRVLFTKPHFGGNPLVIITLANKQKIKGVDDLVGKNIVVNEGYTSDMYMSGIAGINLIRLSSAMISDGLLALQSSRAFAFVTARTPIMPYFEQYGTAEFDMVPIEGTEEKYALAISKHYPTLHKQIQQALDAMESDGTLDTIKEKWNL